MATVSVQVNQRAYVIGCDDGQEQHVANLAGDFDRRMREVQEAVGEPGEMRLMLMTALTVADELYDVRQRLARAQGDVQRAHVEQARVEHRAAQALESAALRVEEMLADEEDAGRANGG